MRCCGGHGTANGGRRRLIAAFGVLALLPAQTRRGFAQSAEDRDFMARAFAMRQEALDRGDQPYGAVIVKSGQLVAAAPSRVVMRTDPTAHAEMEAIRDASRALGTNDLRGCTIYASSRPCPMCTAAAYWANIERIYWGQSINDGGAPRLPS